MKLCRNCTHSALSTETRTDYFTKIEYTKRSLYCLQHKTYLPLDDSAYDCMYYTSIRGNDVQENSNCNTCNG